MDHNEIPRKSLVDYYNKKAHITYRYLVYLYIFRYSYTIQLFSRMKLIFRTSEINRMKHISHWVSINGKSVLQDKFLLKFKRLLLLLINQRQGIYEKRAKTPHRSVLVIGYSSLHTIGC